MRAAVPAWCSRALALGVALTVSSSFASEPLEHRGAFALGAQAEAGAGLVVPVSAGGSGVGVAMRFGLSWLRDGWAIPVTFRLQRGEPLAQGNLSVGAEARRRLGASGWDLALGGGVRGGFFVVSSALRGAAGPDTSATRDLAFPLAPFVAARLEWWPWEALAVKLGLDYAVAFFANAQVHIPEFSLALALTL